MARNGKREWGDQDRQILVISVAVFGTYTVEANIIMRRRHKVSYIYGLSNDPKMVDIE